VTVRGGPEIPEVEETMVSATPPAHQRFTDEQLKRLVREARAGQQPWEELDRAIAELRDCRQQLEKSRTARSWLRRYVTSFRTLIVDVEVAERFRAEVERLESERDQAREFVRIIQVGLQPPGSPPGGGLSVLAHWIVEVNRRLIAAAPDLLAAAEEHLRLWGPGQDMPDFTAAIEQLRNAVAKAKGGP
jgi:hypothetical protein